MKVILLTDVKKVGQRGTLQEVSDGYAQNVLIPKKQAVPATAENLKAYEKKKSLVEEKKHTEEQVLVNSIRSLKGKEVTLSLKSNESGGLFKAVTIGDIVSAIAAQYNVSVPESVIHIDEHIKHTGEFSFALSGGGIKEKVTLKVVGI